MVLLMALFLNNIINIINNIIIHGITSRFDKILSINDMATLFTKHFTITALLIKNVITHIYFLFLSFYSKTFSSLSL